MRAIVGNIDAASKRFGVVVSQFNSIYCERLLDGAIQAITSSGGNKDDIIVVRVPGSFELPLAAKNLIQSHSVDAVICLGVLVKGETDHFEHCSGLKRVAASCKFHLRLAGQLRSESIPAHSIQQVEDRNSTTNRHRFKRK